MQNFRASLKRDGIWGYAFLAPWAIVFSVYFIYPILLSFYLSFFNYNFVNPESRVFVGIGNWVRTAADPLFWRALWNVTYNQIVFNILILAIGMVIALLLKEIQGVGGRILRTLYFIPYVVAVVVVLQVMKSILDPLGPAQRLLMENGIIQEPIFWQNGAISLKLAMPVLALINSWKWFGIFSVILLAGLFGIDGYLYDAAAIDGASAWQRFWNITIPQLNPQFLFILVANTINGLQMFTEPFVYWSTTGGTYKQGLTPVLYLYDIGLGSQHNIGLASALGIMLAGIIVIFTVLNFRFVQRDIG